MTRIRILLVLGVCAIALTLVGVQHFENQRSETDNGPGPEPTSGFDHPWPPVVGEKYPDMALQDLEGRAVRLSSLAGKVLVIMPIGTTSPGSIGFAGGPDCKPLAGFAPQKDVWSLPQLLTQNGVPLDHKDLLTVHLLLFSTRSHPPTMEQARQWVKHFGLDNRANAVVLVGDRRYARQATLKIVPGIQFVDRDFILRADGGGIRSPDNIYTKVIPMVARALGVTNPTAEGTLADLTKEQLPPTRPAHRAAAKLFELLRARDYEGLERECARLRASGREPGGYSDQLYVAYQSLLDFPSTRDHLDTWCAGAPKSAYAHLVRGEHLIDFAWEARGSGWGNTVSGEGWRLFGKRLRLAKESLERAAELDAKLALVPAALITVGMGQGDPGRAIFARFKAAVRIDPRCVTAHRRMLGAMLPRWGGNEDVLFRFVRQAIAMLPDEPAMQLLLVDAHLRVFRGKARQTHLSTPKVKAELDRAFQLLEKAFPESAGVWARRYSVAWAQGNVPESHRCRSLAIKAGSAKQAGYLAHCYYSGTRGRNKDRIKAFELFCKAAHLGDVSSYDNVGFMFKDGKGVRRNGEAALAWAKKGAHGGNARAMLLLGDLHRTGRGTEKNLKTALEWIRKAATGGNDVARKYLPTFLAAHPELDR